MARPRTCIICDHPECDRINELGQQDLPHEEIRALFGSQFSLRTLRNHYDHVEVDSSTYAPKRLPVLEPMETQADMVNFGIRELQKIIVKLGDIVENTGSLRATDHLVRALDSWGRYSDRLGNTAPNSDQVPQVVFNIRRLEDPRTEDEQYDPHRN